MRPDAVLAAGISGASRPARRPGPCRAAGGARRRWAGGRARQHGSARCGSPPRLLSQAGEYSYPYSIGGNTGVQGAGVRSTCFPKQARKGIYSGNNFRIFNHARVQGAGVRPASSPQHPVTPCVCRSISILFTPKSGSWQLHTALIASDLSPPLQASRDPSDPVARRGPPARQACVAIQGPWACAATLHRGPRDSDFLPMQNNAGSCECPCILPVGKVCCPSLPGSCGNRDVNESTYCQTITILANLL